MKATFLDMRRNPQKILDAINRSETVTLTYRGKAVANIEPIKPAERGRAADHPAFGMWAGREDLNDPAAHVRNLRKARHGAL